MQILVFSDSHGATSNVESCINAHPEIKNIFFLGDGYSSVENLSYIYNEKTFYMVSGNCDGFLCFEPTQKEAVLCQKRIFFTHGHNFDVKSGIDLLYNYAKNANIDIVLYGHTHIAKCDYIDGIYFINPGSIAQSRNTKNSYAVITIEQNGILPSIIYI